MKAKNYFREDGFMRKMGKTRKGFTLVEMVLVIAIIVILAGVLVVGIGTYLNKAASAASSVTAHNSSVEFLNSQVDKELGVGAVGP